MPCGPQSTTLALVRKAIVEKAAGKAGVLLDGYPRSLEQVTTFAETVSKSVVCLYIECTTETMTARMQKRRAEAETAREDDNDETLQKVRAGVP